jgi:hypothetical protein
MDQNGRTLEINFCPFKQGDMVWLDTQNIKTSHHKMIGPKREGPFEIMKVIGLVTYQLKLPTTWKISQHVSRHIALPIQRNRSVRGKLPQAPPELIEGEEVYEVEDIIRHRK